MGSIGQLRSRLKSVNVTELSQQSIEETKNDYLQENLNQLLAGKTKTGADITPSYLNDPYFKTPAAAQRYSNWKDKITPNSKRKKGTPNYFIDGTFHSTIETRVTNSSIITGSSSPIAASVEAKSKGLFGIGREFKAGYLNKVRPVFMKKIKQKTGL